MSEFGRRWHDRDYFAERSSVITPLFFAQPQAGVTEWLILWALGFVAMQVLFFKPVL